MVFVVYQHAQHTIVAFIGLGFLRIALLRIAFSGFLLVFSGCPRPAGLLFVYLALCCVLLL